MPKDDDSVRRLIDIPGKTEKFGDSVEYDTDVTRSKIPNIPPPPKEKEE